MSEPIPMLLWCPSCGARHVDAGEFATKPHHTHACQSCGMVWRPAIVPTCGVLFLPGFKDGLQRPTLEHYAAATDVLAVRGEVAEVEARFAMSITKLTTKDWQALAAVPEGTVYSICSDRPMRQGVEPRSLRGWPRSGRGQQRRLRTLMPPSPLHRESASLPR